MASISTGADQSIIYILPQRIQRQRLKDIKLAAKKKKFTISESFGSDVTHVVAEADSRNLVLQGLRLRDASLLNGVEVVKLSWLTECLKTGKIIPVSQQFILPELNDSLQQREEVTVQGQTEFPDWACQRGAPLKHHNEMFTKALEVLQTKAELTDGDQDYSRALAFRRASCVLKSLPFTVTNIDQLRGLKDIGNHSKGVIRDILEEGFCTEVEEAVNDPWFQKMKMFTSIFGIGPSTAKKWVDLGWSSVEEAQRLSTSKDWRVQWGLAYHSDLMDPVALSEAETLTDIVRAEAQKILPGVIVQLTGGFRRGKPNGHDIDLLFTHPNEGREVGFLPRLLKELEQKDLILCGRHEKGTFTDEALTKDFKISVRGQLDHFEKWLGIFKLPKKVSNENISDSRQDNVVKELQSSAGGKLDESLDEYEPHSKKQKCENKLPLNEELSSERDWKARRVDLIVSPFSQYYYALVGWTGSKHFNRDLRLYAQRVLQMKLTSHGLYDFKNGCTVPATSEKEVFDILKLPYFNPKERNC